jgi:PAS domain S-box-containing protein
MKDQSKTKQALIQELVSLRQRITELEQSESELKRVESQQQQVSLETLGKSESLMRAITDSAQDAILMMDPTGCISFWNPGAEHIFGYTSEESIGQDLHQFLAPKRYREAYHAAFSKFKKTGQGEALDKTIDLEACRKNGEEFPIELSLSAIHLEDGWHTLGIIRDITERKEVNRKLQEAIIFQQRLIDALPVPIFYKDSEGRYLGCNSSFEKLIGQKREQVIGKSVYEISPKEFADLYHKKDMALFQNPGIQIYESTVKDTDGVTHHVIFHKATFPNPDSSVGGLIGAILDITDRKWAEEALLNSERRLHTLVQTIPDIIWLKDKDGVYLSCNTMFERFFGAKEADIVGKTDYDFVDRELAETFREHDRKAMAAGKPTSKEDWITFADDSHRALMDTIKTPMYDAWGTLSGVLGIGRDITDRKRAEEALSNSEARLHTLVQTIPDLIWLKDKDGVYLSCNTMFERFFGAKEADIVGKTDYDFVDRKIAETFREHDNKAMAAGKTTSNEEWITFADDGHRAFLDTIKTPMYDAWGTLSGVLGIGRDITDRRSVDRIRKALGGTVQAIAVTVEARDPYTAGHQRRVADLARAIATEMNLPIDIIDGVRMAAVIHDLGKISVPAEILSKPTKLKKTEFDLIKEHSQSGYDILKDIDFPWPVARIVLEHHERMNGSGYPNGLKGDNILMESRIIAVADVVESMGSHRPYRPSLGIEAALEEIEKNRGTIYDNAVADACLRLFREKGYQLEGT